MKSAKGSTAACTFCRPDSGPGPSSSGVAALARGGGGGANDILFVWVCGGGCSGDAALFLAKLLARPRLVLMVIMPPSPLMRVADMLDRAEDVAVGLALEVRPA